MIAWMTMRTLDPKLALAQLGELRQQVPLLYLLLSVNTVAAAYTHFGLAPTWMTLWIPAVLIAVSLGRFVAWRLDRRPVVSPAAAAQHLRRTTLLSFLLAAAFVTWALHLSRYGGDAEHAHVAIYIATTVIGCIFCLFPLPQAAVAVTITVTVPYLLHHLSLGQPIYMAIAVNITLVTLVMMRVLLNNHRGFTELVRLNDAVTKLSRTDPLTGLPNRRHFFEALDARLAALAGEGSDAPLRPLVAGVIDLDGFKLVNDTYGHRAGDDLLHQVGRRLGEAFEDRGFITRLGGDEFAFLVEADVGEASALADEACRALSRPFHIGEVAVSIGASCGLARFEAEMTSATNLYAAADYALYMGKSHRRGFATVYSAEHARLIHEERQIESALQSADFERELDIVVQPIVDAGDGRVMAVEALARWTSPAVGAVSPATFIPLAERTGLIHRMTLALFAKALACAERLPRGVRLSFNLSAYDLASPETMVGLLAMIRRSSVLPGNLILELTETALMRDFAAAEGSIAMLRAAGVNIALDDFGTGYSSLEYLRRLPIDKVKIDRGFVADIDKPGGRELLAGIFALCDRMGMTCIAEGVEDEAQVLTLRQLGCPSFQGYHFARPMTFGHFLDWNGTTPEARRA